MPLVINTETPTTSDIVDLLEQHLAFAMATSPSEHVHALDLEGLGGPGVSFYAARLDGDLKGVGALRSLGVSRGEIKSMHTARSARGLGVGRAMLRHLVAEARDREYEWVGLETGTMEAFAAARSLYLDEGFEPCEPFGSYTSNEFSLCMSASLV